MSIDKTPEKPTDTPDYQQKIDELKLFYKQELTSKFVAGGMFVVQTLRETLQKTGSTTILPSWLDTMEKGLNNMLTSIEKEKPNATK